MDENSSENFEKLKLSIEHERRPTTKKEIKFFGTTNLDDENLLQPTTTQCSRKKFQRSLSLMGVKTTINNFNDNRKFFDAPARKFRSNNEIMQDHGLNINAIDGKCKLIQLDENSLEICDGDVENLNDIRKLQFRMRSKSICHDRLSYLAKLR